MGMALFLILFQNKRNAMLYRGKDKVHTVDLKPIIYNYGSKHNAMYQAIVPF
jgi:hypothetical protein